MKQRRKFPRLNENWKISYRVVEGKQFEQSPVKSLALNISGGGLCFESATEIQTAAMVALELSSEGFQSPIIALAKVVWCKKRLLSAQYEVGAEFWWGGWQSNEAQNTIASYVTEKTKE